METFLCEIPLLSKYKNLSVFGNHKVLWYYQNGQFLLKFTDFGQFYGNFCKTKPSHFGPKMEFLDRNFVSQP